MWIESHETLARHPKMFALCDALKIAPPQAIGHLHLFWWWCLAYAPDGALEGKSATAIARGAEWTGDPTAFVEAIVNSGFVDRDEDGLNVHDWQEFGGKYHAKKDTHRKRMKAWRKGKSRDNHVTRTSHARGVPVTSIEEIRLEERRGEEKESAHASEASSGEFPEDGLPYRLSARLRELSPFLGELTPEVLTSTVFLIQAYRTLPDADWFRAAEEFAANVNGAGEVPERGAANGFQSFLRTRFTEFQRQQAFEHRISKKNGAPGEPVNPSRSTVPRI